MSLLKPKEKEPAGLLAIDRAKVLLDEIMKDTETATEKSRERTRKLGKERAERKAGDMLTRLERDQGKPYPNMPKSSRIPKHHTRTPRAGR
jgi:hypothetical protein